MTFYLNGVIASEVIDRDAAKRIQRGYIGLQLSRGGQTRIEFRNLRVNRAPARATNE